jgi:hypothetical protein
MLRARLKEEWRFRCPECGVGDIELGALATAEQVYCEVCFTEDGRYVRLRRWVVGDDAEKE